MARRDPCPHPRTPHLQLLCYGCCVAYLCFAADLLCPLSPFGRTKCIISLASFVLAPLCSLRDMAGEGLPKVNLRICPRQASVRQPTPTITSDWVSLKTPRAPRPRTDEHPDSPHHPFLTSCPTRHSAALAPSSAVGVGFSLYCIVFMLSRYVHLTFGPGAEVGVGVTAGAAQVGDEEVARVSAAGVVEEVVAKLPRSGEAVRKLWTGQRALRDWSGAGPGRLFPAVGTAAAAAGEGLLTRHLDGSGDAGEEAAMARGSGSHSGEADPVARAGRHDAAEDGGGGPFAVSLGTVGLVNMVSVGYLSHYNCCEYYLSLRCVCVFCLTLIPNPDP